MTADVAGVVERFNAERPTFERAVNKVKTRVGAVADGAQIHCQLTGRVKDPRSFHKKILARRYEDPWKQLTDKAGVRAIVDTSRAVDELCDTLLLEFGNDVLNIDDKRQVTNPEQLAYSGVHMQVIAYRTRRGEPIECEIQLRTIAQDAWSLVSHRVLYKPVLTLPPAIQHAAYRLVALVELFDEEVQRILTTMSEMPGSEIVDLLDAAEAHFLPLARSPWSREFSAIVLEAIAPAFDQQERANYTELLGAFVEAEREKLIGLFKDYGAHSSVNYMPNYVLFGQPESIVLLERLVSKPHKLISQWHAHDLPMSYLETLAGAAGASLPQ